MNKNAWATPYQILAIPEINGSKVKIKNIRDFKYRSEFDYDQGYYNAEFDAEDLKSAVFNVVPFSKIPTVAHFLIIFEFRDNRKIVFSAEVRYKRDQQFAAWQSFLGASELVYIIADPNDVIELREKHRTDEWSHDYYPLKLNQNELKRLFLEMSKKASRINTRPEKFHIFNSCSSNIARHLQQVSGVKIPFYYKYFAPRMLPNFLIRKGVLTNP